MTTSSATRAKISAHSASPAAAAAGVAGHQQAQGGIADGTSRIHAHAVAVGQQGHCRGVSLGGHVELAIGGAHDAPHHAAEDHAVERRHGPPVQVSGQPARGEGGPLPVEDREIDVDTLKERLKRGVRLRASRAEDEYG